VCVVCAAYDAHVMLPLGFKRLRHMYEIWLPNDLTPVTCAKILKTWKKNPKLSNFI